MPAGSQVRPERWKNVIDLYDDGDYSAVWGSFDGNQQRCLGVRWNGGLGEPGYPGQGGHSLWFVEPEFVARAKLLWLLNQVNADLKFPNRNQLIVNILVALRECPSERG